MEDLEPEPLPEDLFVPEESYFDVEKFKDYLDDKELPPHLRRGPDWSCCGKRCCLTFWGILVFCIGLLVLWPVENGEVYSAIKAGHTRRFRNTIDTFMKANGITDVDSITLGQGRTGLHVAAQLNQPRIMQYLLKIGANPNAKRPGDGRTPLHVAANYERPECARVLLEGGAEVDSRADYEWTPLLTALYWSSMETAKVLLAAGADTQLEQGDGFNAVEMAISYGEEDTVYMVLEAGGEVESSRPRYTEYTRWRSRWEHVKKEREREAQEAAASTRLLLNEPPELHGDL